MAQYIEKEKLQAELDRQYDLEYKKSDDFSIGKKIALRNTLAFIDTIEINAVDLDKACKWLEENAGSYLLYSFCEYDKGALLEDFRKAMKEE